MVEKAAAVWMKYGALDYRECVGDDLETDQTRSFLSMAGADANETVVFSWIVYKSKEHRDELNEKITKNPRIAEMCGQESMPFDCKKMAYGGFRTMIHREAEK